MLEPVGGPGEDGPAFVPDDLLVMQESDPEQAVEDLPGEFRGMPDVGDLQTWHELEGFRPVRTSITTDRGLVVACCPVLHVAALGGSAAVQAGAITPFRVQF